MSVCLYVCMSVCLYVPDISVNFTYVGMPGDPRGWFVHDFFIPPGVGIFQRKFCGYLTKVT